MEIPGQCEKNLKAESSLKNRKHEDSGGKEIRGEGEGGLASIEMIRKASFTLYL